MGRITDLWQEPQKDPSPADRTFHMDRDWLLLTSHTVRPNSASLIQTRPKSHGSITLICHDASFGLNISQGFIFLNKAKRVRFVRLYASLCHVFLLIQFLCHHHLFVIGLDELASRIKYLRTNRSSPLLPGQRPTTRLSPAY